ncbi:hypothetical protein [Candidatus Nitrosocosmicus sp. R]
MVNVFEKGVLLLTYLISVADDASDANNAILEFLLNPFSRKAATHPILLLIMEQS